MTQWDGPGRLRASDAEREQVATILRAAVSEGRLTLAEGDERLAQVYAATYRDELDPLVADLPGGGRSALFQTPEVLAAVHRRVRRHVSFAVVLASVLVGLWLLSGAHFFWPAIPLFFLFFGVLRHLRFARAWRHGFGGWGPGAWGRGGWGPWGGRGWGAGTGPWGAASDGPGGSGRARGTTGWDGGDWRGGAPGRDRS